MTLSDRLKAAEYERRLAAGLPVDHLTPPEPADPEARLGLDDRGAPVIDLTQARSRGLSDRLDASQAARTLTPVDVASFGAPPIELPEVGDRSRVECEQCGGPCQVDLVDVVNHTVSLSCLSCLHMFRVPLDN